MQIQIFSIPAFPEEKETEALNKFWRSRKIIDVDKQFVANETGAYWSFCVRYMEGSQAPAVSAKTSKTDYKEILDSDTFEIFSELRKHRKQLAQQHGVPVYAVFTNEELAGIAKLPDIVSEKIIQIPGIGQKKTQKYGEAIASMYKGQSK